MSSRYVEGFEDITVDKDLLFDNIKDAINKMPTRASIMEPSSTKKPTKTEEEKKEETRTTKPTPTTTKASQPMNVSTEEETEPEEETEEATNTMESTKSKFINIKNRIENNNRNNNRNNNSNSNSLADLEDNEIMNEFEEEEDDRKNKKAVINKKEKAMKNNTKDREMTDTDMDDMLDEDEEEDTVEGFQGSRIIESRSMKNLLLSLLIAFIGYITAVAAMKNIIPIAEYIPDFKRFKNIIYGLIFFGIVYLCLEVFGC